jgi:acetyltransferase
MEALFAAAQEAGMSSMEGEVLASNTPMLGLMKKLGFEIHPHPEESSLKWVVRRREAEP